jgi:LytR cell envelope-related transcriptional attenuator
MAVSRDLYPETRRRPADRRHLRTAITMLVLASFVAFAGWYAWNTITDPNPADAEITGATTCIPALPTDAPAPTDIRLNVYNATARNGLASHIARALRERGFAIVDVANDPLGRTVTVPAEVRAGVDNEAAAAVVVAQVAGAVFVADNRTDDSVDLVAGDGYRRLAKVGAIPTPISSSATNPGVPAC